MLREPCNAVATFRENESPGASYRQKSRPGLVLYLLLKNISGAHRTTFTGQMCTL